MALAYAVWLNLIARDRAGHFGTDREKQAAVGRTMHPGMKQTRRNEQGTQALVAAGWSAASFRIRTADGWLEVDGIVRPPFGIDQRATDETGNGSWVVTHLPSGLAVVSRVRALAVALALADRIAALTLGGPEHQRHARVERASSGSPQPGLW